MTQSTEFSFGDDVESGSTAMASSQRPSEPDNPVALPAQTNVLPSPPPTPPPAPSYIPGSSSQSRSLTALPSHYFNKYSTFVRDNSAEITRFESLLRNLILFLPAHSAQSSAQLTTEAAHTILTLLTTFNTNILAPSQHDPGYRPTPRQRWLGWVQGNDRNVRPASRTSKGLWRFTTGNIYKRASNILKFVQYIQLLLEMVAKRAGEGMRWRVVVLLEAIKAICRFIMLRVSGNRSVIGTEVGDEEPVRKIDDDQSNGGSEPEPEGWLMPRTGLRLPSIPSIRHGDSIPSFLERKVVQPDDIKAAQRLVRTLDNVKSQASEIIWILRPLIYAIALQRLHGNKKDWRPWAVGVGMELLSRNLAKSEIREHVPGGLRGLSTVDKEELQRRGSSLAWWGMRGAFYENVTGPWIKSVAQKLKGKPLIGMVGTVAEDYEFLWEEYYFSTATV